MRQLNFISTRKVEWRDVFEPTLPDELAVMVRPLTVATCDMDGVAIQGLLPLKGPVPLGHEGEGVIIEVGSGVKRWKIGDRVIIPWKIACGTCRHCGRGHTAQCDTVPPEDAYGWGPTSPQWGGFISDKVVVPWADTMLTALPKGVNPLLACGVADNISDGWRAVAPHLLTRPGGSVLVVGMVAPGSIGLYAAGIAVSLGAERVVYTDVDPIRLAIAEKLGAEAIPLNTNLLDSWATDRRSLSGGFDITVDACGLAPLLPKLIAATSRAGVCVSTAGVMYRGQPIPMDVYTMYRKSMSFHTGWVHTHAIIDEPLRLITEGIFDPSPVTTKIVAWEDAADAMVEPFTKLIISRSE
jgi:threonine dehydrogenase-like Zn-dependent dehydrogenase